MNSPSRVQPGSICVAVAAPDTHMAIASVQPVINQVDVVEIRLDGMDTAHIHELCNAISRPLLFTNRAQWEGGAYQGSDDERILPLVEAIHNRAAFIDLELKTSTILRDRLIDELQGSETRLILSHHNFEMTPGSATLSEILRQQIESGTHIGKIVTMAHDHLDVLRVLNLQCEAAKHNFPLISFCMGEAGRLSRIATILLGGFMTYAALDATQATAPGQLTIQELKSSLSVLSPTINK